MEDDENDGDDEMKMRVKMEVSLRISTWRMMRMMMR